ncbi:nucleotide disphospho-sugar-binding domain-containing protein [Streptomyces sp. NPDC015414]|uniref:nucleotide disphospho-sugar-binding domain-containing protein n=1 Tax=Streptomyces sp. NPDC015414 TaxID=3364957 RepID=UPI0036F764EC
MPRIVVVSPPFASHAAPLSVLAAALGARGAEVYFACAPAFEELAVRAGVGFVPLTVTRNANTGVAEATEQAADEAARLSEFVQATGKGAVEALVTQARHRQADMLADPEEVHAALRSVDDRLRPDWYVVDQLSYPVTLALHCLGLTYATFCPGHPTYVLSGRDALFGVPYDWPGVLRPQPSQLAELRAVAGANDRLFTELFAAFVNDKAPHAPVPRRAFALTSPRAVVYAYPEMPWLPAPPSGPEHFFAGHMTGPAAPLSPEWAGQLELLRARSGKIVLVALGTLLSARADVLRSVVSDVLEGCADTAVVVAAGDRTEALADLAGERVVVRSTVPQQQLLGHVDAMVHHGGGNSFTECLRAGVPALVLPLSSDQFAIAQDAERAGVGLVLDPNALARGDVAKALGVLAATVRPRMPRWARELGRRGPDWAARHLMATMPDRATAQ